MIFPSDTTANWIRARLDGLLPRDELLPRDLLLYYDGSDAAYDAYVDRLVEVLQERYPPPSQFSPSGRVVRQTFAPAAPLPHLGVPRLSPPPRPTSGMIPDVSPPRARQRKPRPPTPDELKTVAQAAAKLGCSIKTLNGHVASGALRYVIIGHGKKRPRRRYTDADLDEFVANQTRKDSPCPSTASAARHTGISTSTGEVIDFRGPRRPAPSGKRKK